MKYYTFEDNTIIQSVINKTVVSLNTRCSVVNSKAFTECQLLENISLPWCKSIGAAAFMSCTTLSSITLSNCSIIDEMAFQNCTLLSTVELLSLTVCSLANSNAFTGTPIANSTGSIFVPGNLVESYKAAENWSYYSNRIAAYTP